MLQFLENLNKSIMKKFEIWATPSLDLFLFITSFIKSTSMPNTAAIAPTFTGTASCIDLPLSFKILAPSFKVKEFEQIKEVYSPKEWPAKKL